MDVGLRLLEGQVGVVTAPVGFDWAHDRNTPHPFTRVQLTDKGIAGLIQYVAAIREAIGIEIPPGRRSFRPLLRQLRDSAGKALTPYQIAWMEDVVP